jgi:chromate reductase, NAD(P)H dehydrogenase (quinone)
MRILALAGSLRAASINVAACEAAAVLAPRGCEVVLHGLGELPLFNPDLEARMPAPVQRLRAAVGEADALWIASPEYAHGISGVLKNALDWLVSDERFPGKPVALINTSPRACHAWDATAETLRTMSARLVPGACVTLPLLGWHDNRDSILADPALCAQVAAALAALVADAGSRPPDR